MFSCAAPYFGAKTRTGCIFDLAAVIIGNDANRCPTRPAHAFRVADSVVEINSDGAKKIPLRRAQRLRRCVYPTLIARCRTNASVNNEACRRLSIDDAMLACSSQRVAFQCIEQKRVRRCDQRIFLAACYWMTPSTTRYKTL
jgi:hypothetical protein